jgi:hypothetical protein
MSLLRLADADCSVSRDPVFGPELSVLAVTLLAAPMRREDRVRNGRRQDRQQLLTYASINDAPLYRAIIEIFITAADAYQTRLRLADVLAVLSEPGGWPEPVDLTELDRRLEQLCEWGNLYHERDDALTNSLAEFEGRGYIYYLTPGGEAAHAAVEALEDGLERTGGCRRRCCATSWTCWRQRSSSSGRAVTTTSCLRRWRICTPASAP